MNFHIEFYITEDGDSPVEDFVKSLQPKMRAKVASMIELLGEYGNALRKPYSEHLDDGIFELRCKFASDITRVLYFFYIGKRIILTNGFVKKTPKTPPEEIALAKKRREVFIRSEGSK